MIGRLKGYKTYIIAAAVAVVAFAQVVGWIDTETATALYGLLGAGGLAAVRAGIAKGR